MNNKLKKASLFALITMSAGLFGVANALPASECKVMYDDCMDEWLTTSGGCSTKYLICRNAPGKE